MTDPNLQSDSDPITRKRERSNRPFPSSSYEEAEAFAQQVFDFASGNPARRLLLFNHMNKSPESSASRDLITNSAKYGLTKGSYKADQIELSQDAQLLFGDRSSPKERARIRVKLAVESIPVFLRLYETFKDLKLPARAALVDAAREAGVPAEFLEEGIDTFLINLKTVGLMQSLSGAERIVSVDHMLDLLPSAVPAPKAVFASDTSSNQLPMTSEQASFETTCFYVTPIGEEGTEFRKAFGFVSKPNCRTRS